MRPQEHAPVLLALLLFFTLAFAGCVADDGGQNNTTSGPDDGVDTGDNETLAPPTVTLEVSSVGTYPVNPAYDPATLEAPAGSEITVEFSNEDTSPQSSHDWVLEGVEGASTDTIGTGAHTNVTFMAPEPGDYTYFCSVPGHRDAGMEGTLTITGDNTTAGDDNGTASLWT